MGWEAGQRFLDTLGGAGQHVIDTTSNVLDFLKVKKHSRPTPYYWAKNLGGISPQTLPSGGAGFFPETGFAGKPIPGIHSYYTQKLGDASAPIPTYKYGGGGAPRWREGWYEPYYNAMVRAQLREKIGMGTQDIPGDPEPAATTDYGNIIDPEKSKFMKLSEAGLPQNLLSRAEELGITTPGEATLTAGHDEPLIARGAKTELTQAGDLFASAERAYQDVLEAIELKETTALEEKEGALEQIRTERLRSQREVIPAQEQARAAQAATGMAYSAPAEQVATDVDEATLESKLDFKGAELESKQTYEDLMEGYEQERGIEEEKFTGEKEKFESSLGGVFRETAKEAEDVANLAGEVMTGHKEYGESTMGSGRANIMTSKASGYGKRYGGGIGGTSGLWQEVGSPEAELVERVGEEAQTFAQQLEEASASLFQDLNIPGEVDKTGGTY